MPLETAIRLVCDICETPSDWLDGAIYTRIGLIRIMRAQGWFRRSAALAQSVTLCPLCAAKGLPTQ